MFCRTCSVAGLRTGNAVVPSERVARVPFEKVIERGVNSKSFGRARGNEPFATDE